MNHLHDLRLIKAHVLTYYNIDADEVIRVSSITNDVYRIRRGTQRWYLRVSKHGTRQLDELTAEMAWIFQLDRSGVRVARPLTTHHKQLILPLDSGEGCYAVLFEDLGDNVRGLKSDGENMALGQAMAKIHSQSVSLPGTVRRLDKAKLIDLPYQNILEIADQFGPLGEAITKTADALRMQFDHYAASTPQGLLHGDLHNYNLRFNNQGVCFFDFDNFGYGPQMYDLGEQLWNILQFNAVESITQAQVKALLEGYVSVQPLDQAALDSLPYFAAVRAFWWMGTQVQRAILMEQAASLCADFVEHHLKMIHRARNFCITC